METGGSKIHPFLHRMMNSIHPSIKVGVSGGPMDEKPLAQQLFDLYREYNVLEAQVEDEIIHILGKDPNNPEDWGFSCITTDGYDSSFELKGCTQEFHLSSEQHRQLKDLGFIQCWFCTKPLGEYDPGMHIWL